MRCRWIVKLLAIVVAGLTGAYLSAQEKAPFNKTFADGTRVFHVTTTITEFRSRPRASNPDVPSEEIYDREWKITTNTLRLQPAGAAESVVIWSDVWQYPSQLIESLPDTAIASKEISGKGNDRGELHPS